MHRQQCSELGIHPFCQRPSAGAVDQQWMEDMLTLHRMARQFDGQRKQAYLKQLLSEMEDIHRVWKCKKVHVHRIITVPVRALLAVGCLSCLK